MASNPPPSQQDAFAIGLMTMLSDPAKAKALIQDYTEAASVARQVQEAAAEEGKKVVEARAALAKDAVAIGEREMAVRSREVAVTKKERDLAAATTGHNAAVSAHTSAVAEFQTLSSSKQNDLSRREAAISASEPVVQKALDDARGLKAHYETMIARINAAVKGN
jgi:hypothetical protein